MHGGVSLKDAGAVSYGALEKGLANLGRHIENLKLFGVPVVVAINRFTSDTSSELAAVETYCKELGVPVSICTHWAEGGRGAEDLARQVVQTIETTPADFKLLYRDEAPLFEKIETIARKIYRADRVEATDNVRGALKRMEEAGFGRLPVCMAKTQYSFSTDPKLIGAPEGHVVQLREVRLSAGAGFVVGICGDIMTMPGLPRHPAAEDIFLNADGEIEGLF
jgi:formate--tetrahydrofolate ligase